MKSTWSFREALATKSFHAMECLAFIDKVAIDYLDTKVVSNRVNANARRYMLSNVTMVFCIMLSGTIVASVTIVFDCDFRNFC